MEAFARLVDVKQQADELMKAKVTPEIGNLKLAVDNYWSCLQADIIEPSLEEIEDQITKFEERLQRIVDKVNR